MSTYLVAFIVSDLSNVSNGPTDFPHRVFVQPKDLDSTEFALIHGEVILHSLENYLQMNYSLPKVDHVAVPDMFFDGEIFIPTYIKRLNRSITISIESKSTAMENWGIITYREKILLWNESRHSHWRQMNSLIIISHELSHQFFGNLVSPQHWTYTWLNEGFATIFGFIGANLVCQYSNRNLNIIRVTY